MELYNDNEQEVTQVEQIEQPEEVVDQPEEEVVQEAKSAQESEGPQESWKKLRQKAELADQYQRERDEYARVLQDAEKYIQAMNKQASVQQEPPEPEIDFNSLEDDDLLTGKELKNAWKKEQKRLSNIEQKMKDNDRATHEKTVESELTRKYSDFYDVINEENLKKLRDLRPGLARSLHYNPDLKEKAMETYQAIKDLGIYESSPTRATNDHEIVQKNAIKPRSTNSINPQKGTSPLNNANMFANGLTAELKKKLYEDMLDKAGK